MNEFNYYPVFEPDQVLTADHLNAVVDYLELQDRLSRNKLIGIGIVCGFDLKITGAQIEISKGCGITSEGYLIYQDKLTLTHYRPYTIPEFFNGKYKAIYQAWDTSPLDMLELLTDEDSENFTDAERLPVSDASSRVVVLFLEMKDTSLKNCVEMDCDDKGEKMEFIIKPVLVLKTAIDNFVNEIPDESVPVFQPKLKSVDLKRFNVPFAQLDSKDKVLNAFLNLVDKDKTLTNLAEALSKSYDLYKFILPEFDTNNPPFRNVFSVLETKLNSVNPGNPYFIQYFYDWIDDIIKAYNEFSQRAFDIEMMCCPSEELFPLHLMLGEATKSTGLYERSQYRNYFIYSPLFNSQRNLLSEVQLLFKRLNTIVLNYKTPAVSEYTDKAIMITPSKFLDAPLSDRAIPYYYDPEGLYQCWSWDKTRRGIPNFNLSYNASKYNSASDTTVAANISPLLYDIEKYNFFRIEGHIGKKYDLALKDIIAKRNLYGLPFDVIALSTADISSAVSADDYECHFRDLESLYQTLKAFIECSYKDYKEYFESLEDKTTATPVTGAPVTGAPITGTPTGAPFKKGTTSAKGTTTGKTGSISGFQTSSMFASITSTGKQFVDFMKTLTYAPTIYISGFKYLFSAGLSQLSLPDKLADLDIDDVEDSYTSFKDFAAAFKEELIEDEDDYDFFDKIEIMNYLYEIENDCTYEELKALYEEYQKRLEEIAKLKSLKNYLTKNPGIEHKAGVPKGGTFILVYYEKEEDTTTGTTSTGSNFKSTLVTSKLKQAFTEKFVGTTITDKIIQKKFDDQFSSLITTGLQLNTNFIGSMWNFIGVKTGSTTTDQFSVTENTVIADFYLPYICCSDCIPVQFVVSETPVVVTKTCGSLATIALAFDDLEANTNSEVYFKFKELYDKDNLNVEKNKNYSYQTIINAFQDIDALISKTTDEHKTYFNSFVKAGLYKWILVVAQIISEDQRIYFIPGLKLFKLLTDLSMYICCIRDNDSDDDTGGTTMNGIFQKISDDYFGKICTKYGNKKNDFTTDEKNEIKNLVSSLLTNVQDQQVKVKNNDEEDIKQTFMSDLGEMEDVIEAKISIF